MPADFFARSEKICCSSSCFFPIPDPGVFCMLQYLRRGYLKVVPNKFVHCLPPVTVLLINLLPPGMIL